ncbi:MAG: hypothetical protein ACI4LA_04040 [Emergencia sp.]
MFSQKKKRKHMWLWITLILLAAFMAAFFLIGAVSGRTADDRELERLENQAEEDSETQSGADQNGSGADIPAAAEDTVKDTGKSGEETGTEFYQSYYLVKADKNIIKIYFSDETGHLTELEETNIVYEILSPQDQKRFSEGIRVEKRDDLNRLIMDYES